MNDALAEVWAWTSNDVLTHGLPLFHVHGLVLGVVGPLRVGGSLCHVGRWSGRGHGCVAADVREHRGDEALAGLDDLGLRGNWLDRFGRLGH